MRRLARHALNALTALSLLLCVATVGMWGRSYLTEDQWQYVTRQGTLDGKPVIFRTRSVNFAMGRILIEDRQVMAADGGPRVIAPALNGLQHRAFCLSREAAPINRSSKSFYTGERW